MQRDLHGNQNTSGKCDVLHVKEDIYVNLKLKITITCIHVFTDLICLKNAKKHLIGATGSKTSDLNL